MTGLPPEIYALLYINTLMIQHVLAEPGWQGRLTAVDGVPLSSEPKRTLSSDRPNLSAFRTQGVQR
jgi:hypothetical protein